MKRKPPRVIRNNNPGNIRYTGTQWAGVSLPPSDGEFCIFTEPKWGIRALARVLRVYQTKYGICTISGIIRRWTPTIENDTNSYIKSVCHQTGFGAGSELNLFDDDTMLALVKAIIGHEIGQQPYSNEQLLEEMRCA